MSMSILPHVAYVLRRRAQADAAASAWQVSMHSADGVGSIDSRVLSIGVPNAYIADAGLLYGKLASIGSNPSAPRVRSKLSREYTLLWRDRLHHLNLLLRESGAEAMGAVIYRSGDYLLCEIGPAGHTLLLSLDDAGATLTYREQKHPAGSYRSRSWDGVPPLHDFKLEVDRYRQPDQTAWMIKPPNRLPPSYSATMRSSDEDFGSTQTYLTTTRTTVASVY